jgi:putative nucleotidyltransferase with HDIG domain
LSNAFLHSLVNTKNDELNKTYTELKKTYLDTIEALRMTVDAKDEYTCGHSDRVAFFSKMTGHALHLSKDEEDLLSIGGIFHDIGKIGTADDILRKSNKLDHVEYDIIKQHPLKGAHILSALSMFKDVVPLVKHHHEWYDGSGYPDGLKGEEIPFLARILAVADAFDAMTSNRHYRSKLDIEHAKEQLILGSGTQFDAQVVEVFIREIIDNFTEVTKEIDHTYICLPK